jgi:hypothetical protein
MIRDYGFSLSHIRYLKPSAIDHMPFPEAAAGLNVESLKGGIRREDSGGEKKGCVARLPASAPNKSGTLASPSARAR